MVARSLAEAFAPAAIMLMLAWVTMVLRCGVKTMMLKNFAWEDGIMIVALVCCVS